MSQYTTKQGDTYALISRRLFGNEAETPRIRKANPSISEPFKAGEILFIPDEPSKSKVSASDDDVTVLIDSQEYTYWQSVTLSQSFNSFDSASITAPFEPENKEFRKTFIPFSYKSIEIFIGNELVFSGTQMGVTPNVSPESRTVTLSAYSRCAVINDSCVPISAYPVELKLRKLDKITQMLTDAFPFKTIVAADVGASFLNISIEHDKKIAPFLAELCKQRDVVMTNDIEGNLLITKAADSESVAHLRDDDSPVVSIYPRFDEQNYFSDYTAVLPMTIRNNNASYTAKNRKLTNIMRIDNYMATDSFPGDERVVAESRRNRGLANSISYSCSLSTLRDPKGKLFKVNTNINMTAPTAMIYRDTKLFIRGVIFYFDKDSRSCELDLVLPESYNGKEVEILPWEE